MEGQGIFALLLSWLILFLLVRAIHAWISGPVIVPWLHNRFGLEREKSLEVLVTMVIVIAILALSYLPGRIDLGYLCATNWQPKIQKRVAADGYYVHRRYVDAGYAAFLTSSGFKFVEASVPSKPGAFVRFIRTSDNKIQRHDIADLISRYGVRNEFSSRLSGVDTMETIIYEIRSGRELARASSFSFDGGALLPWLFLAGRLSCIDIVGPIGPNQREAHESFIETVLGATAQ